MSRTVLGLALVISLLLATLPAGARPVDDSRCPPGQAKKGACTPPSTDPSPTDPLPTDPAPTDPAPTDPTPTEPTPTEPTPGEAEEPDGGSEPAPSDDPPTPPGDDTDPTSDPTPTDPVPEPAPTDPTAPPADEPVRAFPGAEGAGADAVGGRGGRVIKVTNLEDAGAGSLRACVEASMPRICVFETGGTVHARSNYSIDDPYLTVAGQTAPGDGITIRGAQVRIRDTHDVVVRYIRVRLGDRQSGDLDGIEILRSSDVILDHVSASWSIDETVSLSSARDVTVQWSIISEPLHASVHSEGNHGYCLRAGGSSRVTLHHNLVAHCQRRAPELSKKGDHASSTQVVNNLVYDYVEHATKLRDSSSPYPATMYVDVVGNHYLRGANEPIVFDGGDSGLTDAQVFLSGNLRDGAAGGWDLVKNRSGLSRAQLEASRPFFPGGVTVTDAQTASARILDGAGATVPARDAVDQRVVENVRKRTGRIIDSQDEVGGWPTLARGVAPKDRSGDGIPDAWALANGLDPDVDNASNHDLHPGYTNIEVYINSLAR